VASLSVIIVVRFSYVVAPGVVIFVRLIVQAVVNRSGSLTVLGTVVRMEFLHRLVVSLCVNLFRVVLQSVMALSFCFGVSVGGVFVVFNPLYFMVDYWFPSFGRALEGFPTLSGRQAGRPCSLGFK